MRGLRGATLVALLLTGIVWLAWRSGERPPVDEVALARDELGILLESRRIGVGDVTLHVVSAGPEDGPPVLLLHGFPEFWFSWKRQIAALAGAGFHAIAPDLRGYNRSDKPDDLALYAPHHYASDALGLLDALGIEKTFLAGHDVGGGIAWRLVLLHPERVRKAVIFNVAHPFAWSEAPPGDDPHSISWFRTFFRLPWLPELVGRSGDWWLLSRNLRATSRPGTFDPATLDAYKTAWSRDNAFSTMLNVYRAPREQIPESKARPTLPVRVVWGEQDAFIPLAGAAFTARYLASPDDLVRVPDASHWILLEEPELTSREMIDFFREP